MEMKIQKLEKVGFVNGCQSSPASYRSYMETRWRIPNDEEVATFALQKLEEARQKDIEAHERNKPLIEINKAIAARIEALMSEVGMPRQWSEPDRKSRARFPKPIIHAAGFIGDLARECKTSDGFEWLTTQYERMKATYEQYLKDSKGKAEREKNEREAAAAKEDAKRRADMELATLLTRYELDIMSSWSDVVEALRGKNKYLDLAAAGQAVRNDWSEGPGQVEYAIERFTIENVQDQDIYDDIQSCLEDFEDGRVFRDTKWNYSALFGLVEDAQLLADYELASGRTDD